MWIPIYLSYYLKYIVCYGCSVSQLCLTLCNPLDCNTPGFPVLHHFPESDQTHVHWVIDAIQPSHAKECSNYHSIALISHTSKVMLKIFQAKLQQYLNRELPDIQTGFRKGRGTRNQIVNICWIIKNARIPEKHLLMF